MTAATASRQVWVTTVNSRQRDLPSGCLTGQVQLTGPAGDRRFVGVAGVVYGGVA